MGFLACSVHAGQNSADEILQNDETDKRPVELEKLDVISVTPLAGSGIAKGKIPARVQQVDAQDLEQAQSDTLADYMNRYLGSVTINNVQNNPFQPDVQYRGFTVSPLLGLPQGLSVYVNGIRFNEPFGDSVHWDLIPEGAIETMSLQSGSNPAYGLNSLGGAIAMTTKNGFSAPGHSLQVYGGSWGRHSEELSSGWNNGEVGYFVTGRFFNEDGWRDFSPSDVKQGLGVFSWRGDDAQLDLTLAGTVSQLTGNGALPEALLAMDRSTVFTHPDQTNNDMLLASLQGNVWLNDVLELSGNAYYRRNRIRTLNGDGSELEPCQEDETLMCDEDGEPVDAVRGGFVPASDAVQGGSVNTSLSNQDSFGFALQSALSRALWQRENHFVFGISYDYSQVKYNADSELGALTADRGVKGSGWFASESQVRLHTNTETFSFFLSDTFSLTDKLDITASGRYNHSRVRLDDQLGTALTGRHSYDRFNPAAGLTYAFMPELTFYGGYSESARIPTPMELSCADPLDPCKLPNAFVADPHLQQVVAHTWEAGFRGSFEPLWQGHLDWHLGYFHTENSNDIIFQSTGGVVSNTGFFANVGKTLRQGAELGVQGRFFDIWRWSLNYSYINAVYLTAFKSHSPAHPLADANGDIQVRSGNRIPGIPDHVLKFSSDVDVLPQWTLGFDMFYNGEQVLRGDEANLTDRLPGYVVFNLRTEYRFNSHIKVFGRVENLFNETYNNFGLYANTGSVLESIGIVDQDTRFLGVGAPRAGWVGIKLSL